MQRYSYFVLTTTGFLSSRPHDQPAKPSSPSMSLHTFLTKAPSLSTREVMPIGRTKNGEVHFCFAPTYQAYLYVNLVGHFSSPSAVTKNWACSHTCELRRDTSIIVPDDMGIWAFGSFSFFAPSGLSYSVLLLDPHDLVTQWLWQQPDHDGQSGHIIIWCPMVSYSISTRNQSMPGARFQTLCWRQHSLVSELWGLWCDFPFGIWHRLHLSFQSTENANIMLEVCQYLWTKQ